MHFAWIAQDIIASTTVAREGQTTCHYTMNSEWPPRQRAQSGKGPAGAHTAAQSLRPGLVRLCYHSINAIFFFNQDITVRTGDKEVKVLTCPLFHVSILTAFSSSTLCAPVIKINQVSSFH